MKHLVIDNVGPIDHVDEEMKTYNFIIGPQSSGKSTIAKIFSTCQWIEKEVATCQDENAIGDANDFRQLVEGFHKMKGYFRSDSKVKYETEAILLNYENAELKITLKPGYNYIREKICYIPSERNAVALPELKGLSMGNTNVRSYSFDWFNAREMYDKEHMSNVLNLDMKYFYDETKKNEEDRIIHHNGKTYEIPLSNASSGLQSVVPLTIMLEYYTNEYFDTFKNKTSFDESDKEREIRHRLVDNVVLRALYPDFNLEQRSEIIKSINDRIHRQDAEVIPYFERYLQVSQQFLVPVRTSFIIEEPELNIYPMTQLELMDRIVSLCAQEKKHPFMITTHSPFIVSYINVLLHGNIDINDLNVWTIVNGKLMSIVGKDETTGESVIDGYELSAPMLEVFKMYKSRQNNG